MTEMSMTETSMTEKEAVEWVAQMFDQPVEQLSAETPRDDIAMWDSLGVLTLMAELDESAEA